MRLSGPPLYHGIVVVDIEKFVDQARSDEQREFTQQGVHGVVRKALAEVGTDPDECALHDCGDGVLAVVPATTPKLRLVDALPTRIVAGLLMHNAMSAHGERIRLRCVLHLGDVRLTPNGVVGNEVNHACRLVDAQPLRDALRDTAEPLAVMVSDSFYQGVVRHSAAEPDRFHCVHIRDKEADTTAWIRSTAPARALNGSAAPSSPQARHFDELVAALMEVHTLADDSSRREVLALLPNRVSGAVPHHPVSRLHVLNLVRTCLNYDGGLLALVEALRFVEGESIAMRRVNLAARPWLT